MSDNKDMEILADVLKIAKEKKEVSQPYILYHNDNQYKFEIKKIISGRITDKIIELSKKYPLSAKDKMTMDIHEFEKANGSLDTDKFKAKYKYTDREIIAYTNEDYKQLEILDSREVIKPKFEAHKNLLIEVVDNKKIEPKIWKLMTAKNKESKEFWLDQDTIMMAQIWAYFRGKMR